MSSLALFAPTVSKYETIAGALKYCSPLRMSQSSFQTVKMSAYLLLGSYQCQTLLRNFRPLLAEFSGSYQFPRNWW